jgi:hypothetical protein
MTPGLLAERLKKSKTFVSKATQVNLDELEAAAEGGA